ncbi:PIFO [Bugula neritina]|uniref:PIFO n=1 Tax=Bugula neritina TaxID=10212 RepID=A0A7J7K4V5_BUGNE|nr:PIFO [Bugula neritina]
MGARTGPRFRKEFIEETPAPDCYQTKCTEPMEFETAYKPFSYASERFPVTRRDVEEATPGAGSYAFGVKQNRKVQWHQSFGGAPIKLPDVHIKSTIGSNTAKLLSTRDAKKHHRKLAYLKLYWE